jgi:hypothetical protein
MSVTTLTTTTQLEPAATPCNKRKRNDYDDVESDDEEDLEEEQDLVQDALEGVIEEAIEFGDCGTDDGVIIPDGDIHINVCVKGTVEKDGTCTFTATPDEDFPTYVQDLADAAGADEDYDIASAGSTILAGLGACLARISSDVTDTVKELRDAGDIGHRAFTFVIDDGGNVADVDFE